MATEMTDRRASERFALSPMLSPIVVRRVRDGRMETVAGHAYDISESGMRIEVDGAIEVGERMNVSLTLPGFAAEDPQGAVNAACEVVWKTDAEDDPVSPRAGVRILRYLDEQSSARIGECSGRRWLRLAA